MNTLKLIGETLTIYLLPILFLVALTIINVASYLGFGLIVGLFVTGFTLLIVTIILTIEKSKAIEQSQHKQ